MKRTLRVRTRARDAWRWLVRHRAGWLLVHAWWIDRRYGGWCGGTIASPFSAQGAERTESCDYRVLERLFAHPLLRTGPSDVLVDIGCGKGRVLNFWLRAGLRNRLVGVELTPEVAAWTRERLKAFDNVQIVTGDAVAVLATDGTVFFLFNPFGRDVMDAFAQALLRCTDIGALRIVYLNARHTGAFDAATWDVRDVETGTPDRAVIIRHVDRARREPGA